MSWFKKAAGWVAENAWPTVKKIAAEAAKFVYEAVFKEVADAIWAKITKKKKRGRTWRPSVINGGQSRAA